MIGNYVKKPIWIKAVRWTGKNKQEIVDFCSINSDNKKCFFTDDYLWLKTKNGEKKCFVGDYVILGIEGEYYSVNTETFEKYYSKNELHNIEIGNNTFSFIAPIKIKVSENYAFVIQDAVGTEYFFNADFTCDSWSKNIDANTLNNWQKQERDIN